jgi:predicted dehydrogenase
VSDAALRIALVGLGDIGVRAHLPALAREPRAALVAVADIEEERLDAAPKDVRRTTDVASVLTDPGVDAVVIATPPAATAGLVRTALDGGKWVLRRSRSGCRWRRRPTSAKPQERPSGFRSA